MIQLLIVVLSVLFPSEPVRVGCLPDHLVAVCSRSTCKPAPTCNRGCGRRTGAARNNRVPGLMVDPNVPVAEETWP